MLLNESPSKGEPKMPLMGIGGASRWEAGRWNSPESRSRTLRWVLRDVPLKRKKSTGGLFRGADQLNKEALPLIEGSAADVGALDVSGTERTFFGLPTGKEESYSQYEPTEIVVELRITSLSSTSPPGQVGFDKSHYSNFYKPGRPVCASSFTVTAARDEL